MNLSTFDVLIVPVLWWTFVAYVAGATIFALTNNACHARPFGVGSEERHRPGFGSGRPGTGSWVERERESIPQTHCARETDHEWLPPS